VMETVDERAKALSDSRAQLEAVDAKIAEASSARDEALGGLDVERAHATSAREAIAGKVPEDLLALYEKQRARYGVGASMLRGGVSGASGVALNSSDMTVVRAAAPDDVLLCTDSNAILVRTNESGL
jgi:predicted  nucleic acid-binding Zn-ribbon protein